MFRVFRVTPDHLDLEFPRGWHIGVGIREPRGGNVVDCTPLCDSSKSFYISYDRTKDLQDFSNKQVCTNCVKALATRKFGDTFRAEQKYREYHGRISNYLQYAFSMLINSRQAGDFDEEKKTYSQGSYPFIPHSTSMTLSQFDVLKNALAGEKRWSGNKSSNKMRRKFLDAGCGAGNILLFAKSVGLARYYHGLEYFDDTYKKARDFLGLDSKKPVPDVKIFQQDILTFKNYGDYDIIYFYCPFSYGRLEVKFEELVEDQMKLGAVLIANLKRGSAIYKDERFERLADKLVSDTSFSGIPSKKENIFIKISDAPRKKSQFDEKRSWLHDIAVEGAINKKYGE